MSWPSDTPDGRRGLGATARNKWLTRSRRATPAFAIAGALLAVFIVGPVAKLLVFSPWSSLGEVTGDRELLLAIGLTVASATAATGLAFLFGVPLAYLLARHDFRGRSLLDGLLQLPVLIPHPVAGIAILVFLGRDTAVGGVLARLGLDVVNHAPGLVAAMAFVSAPIFLSAAQEAFRGVDPTLERVARTLGDSEWRAFRRVTMPLARRSLAAAAVVTWARAVSEFGAVVVVTYHPKVASVLIFDRLTTDGLRGVVPAAAVLVVVALIVVAALSVLNRRAGS
jgi:molybdate/tungstate transport system permease protein